MTPRERFQAVMNFRPFDRLPVVEWAEWWDKTIEHWHNEGLPKRCRDRYDICSHFGLDLFKQDWFPVQTPACPKPASHGAAIIADSQDYEKIRSHLYPLPACDPRRWQQWAREQANGEIVIWFTVVGFFWFPRTLFGIEPHFYAFYDQPELMHRINSDLTEWILRIIDQVSQYCVPDFMTFAEDLSYNHGPMLSEDLFNEFMRPYYQQVVPKLRSKGIIPIVDSDGDITVPLKWFEQVGIQGILPLERQAGVDLGRLRQEHPKMLFIGHFDKMTMNRGEAAMRAEFERLAPIAARGGYIIGCDHQTPPGVSYQDYQLFLALFREYAQKIGKMSQEILPTT